MQIQGQVGLGATQKVPDNSPSANFRQGNQGEMMASQVHGRYYEQNYRGNLYCGGASQFAINAATYAVATTGATATPIIGLYNPPGAIVNLAVLQASLGLTVTALAATGPGPLSWMVAPTTAVLTSGSLITPFNCKNLTQQGSQAKVITNAAALTAMTGTLALLRGSSLGGGSASNQSFTATAVAMQTQMIAALETIDGSINVPPGYILALMAGTTPVAHSAGTGILWEEVPL